MKVVIVSPSICDFYFTPARGSAMGARSVKNLLERMGIKNILYNLPLLSPRGKKIALPETHKYLEPYLIHGEQSSISFFNRYKRFGPTPEKSAEIILESEPDIIFISLFAWAYADDALLLSKNIREIDKKVLMCIGGAGVSVLPEYFKKKFPF